MIVAQMLLCLVAAGDDWSYNSREGIYINADTKESRTPEQLYAHAVSLAKTGEAETAVDILTLIARNGPGQPMKEKAFLEIGQVWWTAGEYHEAHRAYAAFAARHPDSRSAATAKRRAMESALQLAKIGDPHTVFGLVTVTSSWKTGVDLLREFLRRYPHEEFSADFHVQLGEFLKDNEEYDEAESEFMLVVETYDKSAFAAKALVHLAQIQMHRFRGLSYDIKPLREARRHYKRFLEEYGKAQTKKTIQAVQKEIATIDGLLAEKQFLVAEYYEDRGYPKAAIHYYRTIRKLYPHTEWANRAARKLEELNKD